MPPLLSTHSARMTLDANPAERCWSGRRPVRSRAYASVEMVQEVVHHRLRKIGDRQVAVANGRSVAALCSLLTFDREVLDLSLELIERSSIRGGDAVHAATALAYGIDRIASTDSAFDDIPGLTRLDPLAI